MLKKLKNLLISLCTMCILMSFAAQISAFGETVHDSGAVNSTINWEYTDGVLTISGTGAMPNFASDGTDIPWNDYKTSVTSAIIDSGITYVGSRAFQSHTALTTVTMADTVTSTGNYVFNSCGKLTSVTLSENLESIIDGTFNRTSSLTAITIPYATDVTSYSFRGTNTNVVISVYDGSAAYEWAVGGASEGLTPEVLIPGSSTETAPRHYEVITPGGAVTENITWSLHGGILTISGVGAMPDYNSGITPWDSYKTSITGAVIDNGITYVGSRTFQLHSALTTVTMSGTVTSIGYYVFNNCSNLSSVTLSANLTSIPNGTFNRTGNLKSLTIPYKTNVAANSFIYTSKDLQLTVYKNYAAHTWAASENNSVSNTDGTASAREYEVVMPSGNLTNTISWAYDIDTRTLTFSGTGAMSNWTTTDTDGSGSATDDETWYELRPWHPYIALATKIVIGEGITRVGSDSFRGGSNLNELVLSSTVKELGNYAFANTGLREVTLNNGLEKIGGGTFQQSSSSDLLTKIVVPNSVNSINRDAFRNQNAVTIYCYADSYAQTWAEEYGLNNILIDSDFYINYSPISSTAVITNYKNETVNSSVIFANFTNNTLTDVCIKEVTLAPGRTEVTAEDFSQENGSLTKVMIVKSMTSMTPLCKAYSVKITPSIHIAGDSISAMWPADRYGQQGWGEPFKTLWTDDIKVVNDAVSGWTAEDFYTRKWAGVQSEMKEGDYLIISYLHNDYSKTLGASPISNYKDTYIYYLQKLIDEAKAKGINVVLVVPPNRGVNYNYHGDFADVMPELAAENNIPYIDIHAKTIQMLTDDLEGTKQLIYMYKLVEQGIITQEQLENHSNKTFRTNGEDLTHLSTQGAAWIANYVAENLINVVPALAQYAK